MSLPRPSSIHHFTNLNATITQAEGAFTLGIQLHNHMMPNNSARGMHETASVEDACSMIAGIAAQFGISQPAISIDFVMENYKDGIRH